MIDNSYLNAGDEYLIKGKRINFFFVTLFCSTSSLADVFHGVQKNHTNNKKYNTIQ